MKIKTPSFLHLLIIIVNIRARSQRTIILFIYRSENPDITLYANMLFLHYFVYYFC